jgi:uncharacterized ubiquitin-like protein YukD
MGNFKKYYIIYETKNIKNGKIYIGMHETDNLDDGYLGSGKRLKRAIRYHGKEFFERRVLHIFDNREDMINKEIELVNEEFVNRDDTYNLITGGEYINTVNTIVVKDREGNTLRVSVDDPRYLSGELVHHLKNTLNVIDEEGNILRVSVDDPRYLSGELVSEMLGLIIVKDKNGNTFRVSNKDPRYLSGELIHISSGKLNIKDKDGNTFRVSNKDPRYLSGELISLWVGKKHCIKTKEKLSKLAKKRIGNKNSQYGTIWITNGSENKKIKKYENIPEEWIKGRTIK